MINNTTKYMKQLYENLRDKVQLKVDYELLESFKQEYEKGVGSKLEKKLDRMELRRAQHVFRRQVLVIYTYIYI